jgi:hypothetical protein
MNAFARRGVAAAACVAIAAGGTVWAGCGDDEVDRAVEDIQREGEKAAEEAREKGEKAVEDVKQEAEKALDDDKGQGKKEKEPEGAGY